MNQVIEWIGNGIALSRINADVYGICNYRKLSHNEETLTTEYIMYADFNMVKDVIELLEYLPQVIQLEAESVAGLVEKLEILVMKVKPIDLPRLLEFKK